MSFKKTKREGKLGEAVLIRLAKKKKGLMPLALSLGKQRKLRKLSGF